MRNYKKGNSGIKKVLEPSKNIGERLVSPVVKIKDAGVNYKKEDGKQLPVSFFVIISGGEVREKNYFTKISDNDKFRRIKIEFIADPKKLNPDGLLELAIYKQKHYATSQESNSKPDRIFIVSDLDHFRNDLIRISSECVNRNISLIISNPCFEIWLYYGKCKNKPNDFIIPDNPLKISKSFKTYLGNKIKGGVNPRYAIFDIWTAIKNAKSNYDEDNEAIPNLFSTNMFLPAEEILPLIEDELRDIIKNADKKIKKHEPR